MSGGGADGAGAAMMERSMARRQESQRNVLLELEELEEAVQKVANNLKSRPAKSTAAQKWEFAHGIAQEAPCIEAWGGGNKHVNGAYNYVPPAADKRAGPVSYQCAGDSEKFLYVSMKGHWFLGNLESKEAREQKSQRGHLRSAKPVEPGVLPHMTKEWEVLAGGEFQPKSTMAFWLAQSVQLAWQKARVELCKFPVMRIAGVGERHGDGLFDFMPTEGNRGEPPVFRHQRLRNQWLYLATDQRWWIGGTHDKDKRSPAGMGHTSSAVQPGMLPAATDKKFTVCVNGAWEERAVEIEREDGQLRAVDCWTEAGRRIGQIELWGSPDMSGAFAPHEAWPQGPGDLPAYRCKKEPGVVLYVGEDGHWWFGTEVKDGKRKEGHIRSHEPVAPGTLPDDKTICWLEKGSKEWSHNRALCFCTTEQVAAAWRGARAQAAKNEVMSLVQSPDDQAYDGLYDYMAEEGEEGGPPSFMHQINQERWMYLGTDGRWWVGSKEYMAKRLPKGRLSSNPVRPGVLPLGDAVRWQSWSGDKKVWVDQPGMTFDISKS